jgi:hypothetical protein
MLATIEDTREKLYNALKTLGDGYHDRVAIARSVGKRVLNPVDTAALDLLASEGRIEKTTQIVGGTGRGSNSVRWVYRVIES